MDPSATYAASTAPLATSLFGEVGVVRQWGRIGNQGQSQSRTDWYEEVGPAEAAWQTLVIQKQRRGYDSTVWSWPQDL